MSWTTTPTLERRKTGAGWTATALLRARQAGQGWFVRLEQLAQLNSSGSLNIAMAIKYPYSQPGYAATGSLSATIKPVKPVAAAFSAATALSSSGIATRSVTVNFTADSSPLGTSLNEGLSGTIIGGVPPIEGLSATITQLVTTNITAVFTAAGELIATYVSRYSVPASLSAVGALSSINVPTYTVPATFSGGGTLTTPTVQVLSTPTAFSTAGNLTPTSTQKYAPAAALTADGSLAATLVRQQPFAPALTASGSLAATGTEQHQIAVGFGD